VAAGAVFLWGTRTISAYASDGVCSNIERSNVVACALRASLVLERERHGVEVEQGRLRAVSPLLPSNPSLTLSGAHRQTAAGRPHDQATNWYATLAQEVELAGQRGARRHAAALTKSAQQQAVRASEREVAAQAWRAWFQALAARDALENALGLERAFVRIAEAAQAGAASGLLSGVDADVAALTGVRLSQLRVEAEGRAALASATLASLVGLDPGAEQPALEGALQPLARAASFSAALAAQSPTAGERTLDEAVQHRPELAEASDLHRSSEYAATALRRGRVPNLTVSLYAQRDGFDERVLGGGLSLPVPLPYPIGRTSYGELAERAARTRQAALVRDDVARRARLEVVAAERSYRTAQAGLALYTESRVAGARQSLESIAGELAAGRLALGNVLVAQQTLIEFLRAHVEAKLTVCLGSVELVRVAGLALEEGGP
jgi:cobalt-zinc-cadmium efflux system outer membrane protein